MNLKNLILICCFTSAGILSQAQITNLRDEALTAIHYLNRIRQNPKAYADSTETSSLKYAKPKPVLNIDSVLMRVAYQKAYDMAEKNYFDHVSKEGLGINHMIHAAGYTLEERWLGKKTFNSFESIAAGYTTGIDNINTLILDKGENPPGHRQHLLGMTDFWDKCVDVGAALVHNPKSKYKYYFVIIIAFR